MKFVEAVREGLAEALEHRSVLLLGQLVKYGLGGVTEGLHAARPRQVLTMPVAENLMHGAAFGLALAGMRPVVINERMDFLPLAMDPIVNHIAVWPKRAPINLPITIIAVVGKGKGQGPQHSKNLTPWFRMLEGITVVEPSAPQEAKDSLLASIFGERPVLYVLHREHFNSDASVQLPNPAAIGLCGASARHEREFYER